MYCTNCDSKKPLKDKKITHKYTECGLDNVTLHGVLHSRCEKCGEEYYGYGDMEQLHGIIAECLIQKKGQLSGKEVRFLRTHMGYSGAMFAKLISVTPEFQSRVENEKSPHTDQYDLLVRALVENKLPDRRYDLHDLALNGSGKTGTRIALTLGGHGWQSAA